MKKFHHNNIQPSGTQLKILKKNKLKGIILNF